MRPGGNSCQPAQNLDVSETVEIGRDELGCEMPKHRLGAETAEIEVEVAVDWYEFAHLDPDSCSPFAQTLRRVEAGHIIVAGDIEPAH